MDTWSLWPKSRIQHAPGLICWQPLTCFRPELLIKLPPITSSSGSSHPTPWSIGKLYDETRDGYMGGLEGKMVGPGRRLSNFSNAGVTRLDSVVPSLPCTRINPRPRSLLDGKDQWSERRAPGLTRAIMEESSAARSLAGIAMVTWVASTVVVVRQIPFQRAATPGTKFVSVSVKDGVPGAVSDAGGELELRVAGVFVLSSCGTMASPRRR
jgi:hypothetical protein